MHCKLEKKVVTITDYGEREKGKGVDGEQGKEEERRRRKTEMLTCLQGCSGSREGHSPV